ncbi:MAG: competence/damage-inducible protein A [Polyangiaceae bacterium]|nr:competence/damage-inducible protein A [Myxococcales bacterium]MCB9587111.1 competence/damage-inducible protein A [Polyangiaceae bacterium]MCB9609514.1 competence/damage-inducible protein A [Polyangiaceae bacterium]
MSAEQSPAEKRSVSTAAALIIGDELLSGKIREENIYELAKLLRTLGIRFCRVNLIGDDLDNIANEVKALSETHDVVFTSGGVGPTHDDITIEGVAKAFGVEAQVHADVEALLQRAYGERYHEGHQRMALVPEGAELLSSEEVPWPTIVMRNVWVLPGVPEVFRMKLLLVKAHLVGTQRFLSRAVFTKMDEGDLKPLLDQVVAHHSEVAVGSYPRWRSPDYKTKITFDAASEVVLQPALDEFLQLLPEGEPQRVE